MNQPTTTLHLLEWNTHENTAGVIVSCSLSSSQNTAGLPPRKKKNGMSGKKNPSTIPSCKDETAG